jgi:hypothetical protein
MVGQAFTIPPAAPLGPLTEAERRKVIDGSLVAGHYDSRGP